MSELLKHPMSELLKQMGFTTPFVYAAAVYVLFHYLDKKASGQAKKAISGWLQPREYDKAAIADAMVEIFDRLYTRPLLGWRAFMRSTLFTICMTAVFLYEFGLLSTTEMMSLMREVGQFWVWLIPISILLANVICDYLALFIIRPFLVFGKSMPMLASLLAPIAGISIVLGAYYGVQNGLLFEIVDTELPHETYIRRDLVNDILVKVASASYLLGSLQGVLRLAAFVVHLWLPLFALCVMFLRSLNYFRVAVGGVQWFLEKGREHPLNAIGAVAASLVFVATVVIQHMAVIAAVLRQ